MWPGKLLSTTCCISNRRLFDDGTASEDGDVSFSVVVVVEPPLRHSIFQSVQLMRFFAHIYK